MYIEEFVKLPCPGQLQLPGERDLQLPDPDNIRRRKHSMAYVTAVVGAGGKTGYIREKAQKNALMGKKTAVMTTTHILEEPDSELIRYIGLPDQAVSQNARKLIWPGDEIYRQACLEYDEVLVEADGAKHYPLKIPAHYEPVIPENVSEIVVVMSGFALGRDFREICFREELADPDIRELTEKDPVVTRELVDRIARKYYTEPLERRFSDAKVSYFFHDEKKRELKDVHILAVLMASGLSRRFGPENKLLAEFRGKKLYRYQLDALQAAAKNGLRMDIAVASCYDEILKESADLYAAIPLKNNDYAEGISASIRTGAEYARKNGYDAAAFFAADQPGFGADDTQRLLKEFVFSGRKMACAFCGHPANPAVFDKKLFPELAALGGDSGAMKLIKADPGDVHYYITDESKLKDIDTQQDLH